MREPPRGMLRNSRAPFSNVRSIRGSRGGNIAIERRRTDTETVRDLRDTDVGVGEHRLGSLDVVIGEFRRSPDGTASTPRGGEARLGTLPDQAALEFRQRTKHVKNEPALRG